MGHIATFACLAVFASGAAVALPPAGADAPRTVQFEVRQGGRLLGAPSVTLAPGRSAALSVGGVYALRMRLERATDTIMPTYRVRSTLYRADGGGVLVAAPAVTLAEGEQARLRLDSGGGAPILFAVLVE
jgi:hypothetical protein